MRKITLLLLLLLLLASCAPPQPVRPGPQNPGVTVDDDGHCRFTRSAMMDRPAATVWATGCR